MIYPPPKSDLSLDPNPPNPAGPIIPTANNQPSSPIQITSISEPSTSSSSSEASGKRLLIKIVVWVIVLIILAGLGFAGYFMYQLWLGPQAIVARSLNNLIQSDSFLAKYTPPADSTLQISLLEMEYHKQPEAFKKFSLQTQMEGVSGLKDFGLSVIVNDKDAYTQVNYQDITELETLVGMFVPGITSLQSYQMLKPTLTGDKWLYIADYQKSGEAGGSDSAPSQITPEQEKHFLGLIQKALIIKNYQSNYQQDNKRYKRIAFGFDQEKLLVAVDYLKELKLDISVQDINSLRDYVNSSQDWDSELFVLLIEDQYLYSVSLSLPQIPTEIIENKIGEAAGNTAGAASFLAPLKKQLDNLINQDKQANLQNLGTLTFTGYNSLPDIEIPLNTVNSQDIIQIFAQEAPSILPSLPANSPASGLPPTTQQPPAQTPLPAAPSKYTSYGEKIINNTIGVTVTSAKEVGEQIVTTAVFRNTTATTQTIQPQGIQMRSTTHGTIAQPTVLQTTLAGYGQKSFTMYYQKLENPPYKFITFGETELGIYTP